jgi:hypothetical protein
MCEKLNIPIMGYDLKEKEEIASGMVFPETILKTIPIAITWYPIDYIELPSESIQAKETEETNKVRQYMKEQGYIDYLNDCKKKILNNTI